MARSSMGKGAIIEKYLDEHPGAAVAEVVDALKRHGITPAYVHQIRHRRKNRGLVDKPASKSLGRATKGVAMGDNGIRSTKATSSLGSEFEGVVAAYRFIVACGGVDRAHAAIDGAAQLMSEMGLK